MKRTRKWAFVAQEAQRLAGLGLAPGEIASRIGVNKSTVSRWMSTGKLSRTEASDTKVPPPVMVTVAKSPDEWAAAIRETYDLDATDEQLVALAQSALSLSLDSAVPAGTRMTAAGRFQALVRQLALVARVKDEDRPSEDVAEPAPVVEAEVPKRAPGRVIVQRTQVDPRTLLVAVK